MFRRLRANGPVVLVPLAWAFVTAAHLGVVRARTLLIAHVVMDVLLAAFLVLSWSEMTDGALRTWRTVILLGLPATLAGTAGLAVDPHVPLALALSVGTWVVVPAVALLVTGRAVDHPRAYLAGGALSLAGGAVYGAGVLLAGQAVTVAGLALVGIGQTAGIADAVFRY